MYANELKIKLLIIMSVLLLIWLLLCVFFGMKKIKKDTTQLDFDVEVKCEKCNTIYHKKAKDFVKGKVIKQKSITKTKVKGVALVNTPEYKYFAKKFDCPCCQKSVYGQVLNLEEIQSKTKPISIKNSIKMLIVMFIGGCIIIGLMMIPMHIVDTMRYKEIERLKQEQQEEIYERYGIEDESN